MRPPTSWSELAGRRVGIFGLGVEGRANFRAALSVGADPILVDDKPDGADDLGQTVWATAPDGLARLLDCDVVIKTPGISRYSAPVQTLIDHGVPVVGGVGLWLQGLPDLSRVLCITGTKGKSTTTSIAGHLLTRLGHRTFIGGNLGVPPQDPAVDHAAFDFWIIEVSSYQATDLTCAPPVFAVTSLNPDHLPWHRDDVEIYYRDKLSATHLPGADLTVTNGDSELLRARRDLLGPRVEWVHATDDPDATWMNALGLPGAHNRRNALIAQACLWALGIAAADDRAALAAAAQDFHGLPSRLQVIGEIDGVTFVDDGLSTNVLPTLAAVESFPDRPVALLLGGQDRGIDYRPLAVGLRDRVQPLRVFPLPDSGAAIAAILRTQGTGDLVEVGDEGDLTDQVRAAFEWARPGGVVLLSPAAPSFGRFRDYRHRGEVFAAAMRLCES